MQQKQFTAHARINQAICLYDQVDSIQQKPAHCTINTTQPTTHQVEILPLVQWRVVSPEQQVLERWDQSLVYPEYPGLGLFVLLLHLKVETITGIATVKRKPFVAYNFTKTALLSFIRAYAD